MEQRSPGLLLQAIPYLGKKKILKILTPDAGLISLLVKTVRDASLLTPFCLAEWVYKKGQKDLHVLIDASLSDGLLQLKTSYPRLCAAGQIAQELLHAQMPGVYSPELFVLVCSIFQKIGSFDHPEVLVALFRLKWLQQDGLLAFRSTCSVCKGAARQLHAGESYCLSHAQPYGWTLSEQEWAHVEQLLTLRTFTGLNKLTPEHSLYPKLVSFFLEALYRS